VRRYRFTALVTFDPASRRGAAGGDVGARPACCLIEPCHRIYFPAMIAPDKARMPVPSAVRAVVSIALVDGEDVAFFAPGQRFTIWADAIVGHTIRTHGRVGSGVIVDRVSMPTPRADNDSADGRSVSPARAHRLAGQAAVSGASYRFWRPSADPGRLPSRPALIRASLPRSGSGRRY
jgi:hypothetical protein